MRMRLVASGAGSRFFSWRFLRMNRSIGFRTQSDLSVGGSTARSGWSDHQSSPARRSVLTENKSSGFPPQTAPCWIHSLIKRFSFAGSGCSGGISSELTRFHSKLPFVFPGNNAGPFSPPCLRNRSSVSFRPASGSLPWWHSRQCSTRIGAIWLSKSMVSAWISVLCEQPK